MTRQLGQQLAKRKWVGKEWSYTSNWKIGSGWESQPANNEGRQWIELEGSSVPSVSPRCESAQSSWHLPTVICGFSGPRKTTARASLGSDESNRPSPRDGNVNAWTWHAALTDCLRVNLGSYVNTPAIQVTSSLLGLGLWSKVETWKPSSPFLLSSGTDIFPNWVFLVACAKSDATMIEAYWGFTLVLALQCGGWGTSDTLTACQCVIEYYLHASYCSLRLGDKLNISDVWV